MKENWTFENHIQKGNNFIVVSNYEPLNELHNWELQNYTKKVSLTSEFGK